MSRVALKLDEESSRVYHFKFERVQFWMMLANYLTLFFICWKILFRVPAESMSANLEIVKSR
jgi:hypothetical protein